MQLPAELVRLPLRVDADALRAEVEAVAEELWRPHPEAHAGNSALPLVALGGNPDDDGVRGAMAPTPVLQSLPLIRQVLAAIGAPIGRTRLMRLDGDAEATAHVDVNYYWLNHLRVHVPIVTTPGVRFVVGDRETHMRAGEVWVFDTWRRHNVVNPDDTRRIHLVIDTVGSSALWARIDAGEAADGLLPESTAPMLPPGGDTFAVETVNHPSVMSPWELETLVDWLVLEGDLGAADAAVLNALTRDWHARWSVHGDSPSGRDGYRELVATATRAIESSPTVLPNGTSYSSAFAHAIASVAVAADPVAAPASPAVPRRRIAAPVFIVSAPRSGSSLLFETLAKSPDFWSIGTESHEIIEGIPALHPAAHGWESNRLTVADATPDVVTQLLGRFDDRLRDRRGNRAAEHLRGLRLLEKTPKNSLRIPFLAAAFPDARFVYLYRDPVDTMASMLEGWRSGRFVTYRELPGWEGPWSLLLVPGWRDLQGLPMREVVARQWAAATTTVLDDLQALGPDRWCVASYGRLVADPQAEVIRLCRFLGVRWDQELTAPLPLSSTTLTEPDAAKSERNGRELATVLPLVAEVAERARQTFAAPPGVARTAQASRARPAPAAAVVRPQGDGGFGSSHTSSFPTLLERLGISLVVSTYQSGRVITMRAREGSLNTHFRTFTTPMGIAVAPGRLLIGTRSAVWEYRNHRAVAARLEPEGVHDACYLPSGCRVTGDIRIHDVDVAGGETWVVNTAFSCLATLDGSHSFVPRWRPPWVTALAGEDRCHLNGMAVVDDRPKYVTAFGRSDTAGGWRDEKAFGGVIVDIESNEVIAEHLCMPHSPRWHDGKLWVLESGKGTLSTVDIATGELAVVAELPGFTRGLSFAGPFAFVGLSLVRESLFDGVPIVGRDDLACGVWVVDTRSGDTAFVRFSGIVQEIFDVKVLPHRYPEIAEPNDRHVTTSFLLPDAALADVPPR